MKTFLITFLFALTLNSATGQFLSDTLIVRDTIQLNGIPAEIAEGRISIWFAFKCEDWRQIIRLRNTFTGQSYFFWKTKLIHPAQIINPNYPWPIYTMRISLLEKSIIITSLITGVSYPENWINDCLQANKREINYWIKSDI